MKEKLTNLAERYYYWKYKGLFEVMFGIVLILTILIVPTEFQLLNVYNTIIGTILIMNNKDEILGKF